MKIKVELLRNYISDFINFRTEDFEINADEIANTTAIEILAKIQEIIQDENISDFDAIEKIVCLFEEYHIDFGCRHDF